MRVPSRTKTIKRSGMKITYIRESNEYRDEIIIPGLVTKDLKLVVWYLNCLAYYIARILTKIMMCMSTGPPPPGASCTTGVLLIVSYIWGKG